MTKLKQLNPTFPNGDCMRTVLACLLGYEKPDLIPNFTEMENYEENFVKNVYKWLDENNLTYVEIDIESFKKSSYIPLGLCTVVGKSPRGEWLHIVIGEIKLVDNKYELHFVWDTSPLHDGVFLNSVETIGFLSKKIGSKKQSFAPYVDETVDPSESYLVFCENYSPWNEDEKNMIRVHSNEESHKMLEILEHHFGIKNNHKA